MPAITTVPKTQLSSITRSSRLNQDLSLAVEAARLAGALIQEGFGSATKVDYKSPDQPVTRVDREAEAIIRERLTGARPDYGWIAEESQNEPAGGGAPTWVVDPLDGTVNFVEERPEFAVCIGLLDRGTPVLGVVYNPMSNELYTAVRGGDAFRGDVPIQAGARGLNPGRTLAASWTELNDGLLDGFAESWERVTIGSTALKVMRVAEGAVDAYVSFGRKESWDLCAPAAIAEAAGVAVLGLDGIPLTWSRELEGSDGVIVVGKDRQQELSDILRLVSSAGSSSGKGQ